MKTTIFLIIFSITLNVFSQVQKSGTENDKKITIVTSTSTTNYSDGSTKVKSKFRYIYKGQSHDITKNAKSYENIIKDVPLAHKEFKKFRTKKVVGFAGSMIFLVGTIATVSTMFHGSNSSSNSVSSDKEPNFEPAIIGAVISIPFFVINSSKKKNLIKSAEYFNLENSKTTSLNSFELKPCLLNSYNKNFSSLGITLKISF